MVPGSPDAPFHLTQPAGLALPLEEAQNVTLSAGSLDVADNAAVVIIKELHADLRDVTSVSRPAEDTVDLCQLYLCSTGIQILFLFLLLLIRLHIDIFRFFVYLLLLLLFAMKKTMGNESVSRGHVQTKACKE